MAERYLATKTAEDVVASAQSIVDRDIVDKAAFLQTRKLVSGVQT